ncbi:MAG: alpha/beta hydrolase-fold protein [Myxococcota bacterium]
MRTLLATVILALCAACSNGASTGDAAADLELASPGDSGAEADGQPDAADDASGDAAGDAAPGADGTLGPDETSQPEIVSDIEPDSSADADSADSPAPDAAADADTSADSDVVADALPDVAPDLPADALPDVVPGTTCSAPAPGLPALVLNGSGRARVSEPIAHPGLLSRRLRVWLPVGWGDDPARRYPTIYMHDGQNLFNDADSAFGEWRVDETVDALTQAGLIEPHIVVGIDNTADRIDEYAPNLAAGAGGPGKAGVYADFVAQVVVPLAESALRARCDGSQRTIGGSSLGGLASLYLMIRHPGVFGRVAAVSPSLWWEDGEIVEVLRAFAGPWPERLWVDMGTLESGEGGGPTPASILLATREVRDIAGEAGLGFGDRLGALEDFGVAHNEQAWAGRLGSILGFLVGLERPYAQPPAFVTLRPYAAGLALSGTNPGTKTSVAVEAKWPSGQRLTWPAALAALENTTPEILQLGDDGAVTAKALGVGVLRAKVLGVSGELALPVLSAGQVAVSFEVSVPASTPAGATVHISGDLPVLGAWDGVGIALTNSGGGVWRGIIAVAAGTPFAFKATLGSWATVEKSASGAEIADRKATAQAGLTVKFSVAAWAN